MMEGLMANIQQNVDLKAQERISKSYTKSRIILKGLGLRKIYSDGAKEIKAVDDITLSLREGTILAIVGPSGAGKSTLLHLLGGLDRPTSGKVLLDGIDLYQVPDRKRAQLRNTRVGFVFQFYHLLPEFTALENVLLPAVIGFKADSHDTRSRATDLLDKLGLGGRIDHRPSELSGGESQRVAIARALMNNPDILLCDEPIGNLDSEIGGDIISLLADLNRKEGVSLIIATHEESLTKRADEVLHIKDGRLI